MIEIASKIVALIVAAIGAATTIFNMFFKGECGRKQEYYNGILKPFAVAYKKDPSTNAIDFVKIRAEHGNDNIPKYIFYLVDSQDDDTLLKKVLIYDYLNLYPNEYNKKQNLLETVNKLLVYLMVFLFFLFVFMGALVIASGIMTFISFLFEETLPPLADWWNCIKETLIGIAISLVGLIPVKLSEWLSNDMYTVKKRRIQKMINKKARRYDRRIDDYIL